MPAKLEWTDAQNTRLRQTRAEGAARDAIAAAFGVAISTVREQGNRIGARPPPPDFIPPAANPNRDPLPAGDPDTWSLLTAGTLLEGAPYEWQDPLAP